MKRISLSLACLIGLSAAPVWAQQNKAVSDDCKPVSLARESFGMEAKIQKVVGSSTSEVEKFAIWMAESALEQRMISCIETFGKAGGGLTQEDIDFILSELKNLSFINDTASKSGFLGNQSGGFIPYTSQDPAEIEKKVPACRGVLALVPKIREFSLSHRDTSALRLSEVVQFYPEADTISCAFEARKAGYRDVAFQVLSSHLNIEMLSGVARSNENKVLSKALEALPLNTPFTVSIPRQAPLHCTATTTNLGSEKITEMNCY
ncbi:MAG TPA: hypothetical protein VGR03_07810 [Candidatus Acidoferrum sp.]|nr:hypothetical protein [Candidatus Acidoferrum sp.]